MKKHLYRSKNDKVLTGLCGGIAEYFGMNSVIVRLIVVLLSCGSVGLGLIIYFVVSFLIQEKGSDRIEAEFTDADDDK